MNKKLINVRIVITVGGKETVVNATFNKKQFKYYETLVLNRAIEMAAQSESCAIYKQDEIHIPLAVKAVSPKL